jgi:hypothetical protein
MQLINHLYLDAKFRVSAFVVCTGIILHLRMFLKPVNSETEKVVRGLDSLVQLLPVFEYAHALITVIKLQRNPLDNNCTFGLR